MKYRLLLLAFIGLMISLWAGAPWYSTISIAVIVIWGLWATLKKTEK